MLAGIDQPGTMTILSVLLAACSRPDSRTESATPSLVSSVRRAIWVAQPCAIRTRQLAKSEVRRLVRIAFPIGEYETPLSAAPMITERKRQLTGLHLSLEGG